MKSITLLATILIVLLCSVSASAQVRANKMPKDTTKKVVKRTELDDKDKQVTVVVKVDEAKDSSVLNQLDIDAFSMGEVIRIDTDGGVSVPGAAEPSPVKDPVIRAGYDGRERPQQPKAQTVSNRTTTRSMRTSTFVPESKRRAMAAAAAAEQAQEAPQVQEEVAQQPSRKAEPQPEPAPEVQEQRTRAKGPSGNYPTRKGYQVPSSKGKFKVRAPWNWFKKKRTASSCRGRF